MRISLCVLVLCCGLTSLSGQSATTITCAQCPANQYLDSSDPASPQCVNCPADSNSPSGQHSIDACQCNAGFQPQDSPNEHTCEQCAIGKYKIYDLDRPCDDCPDFSSTNSTGAKENAYCDCMPGYGTIDLNTASVYADKFLDGAQCAECAAGKHGQSYRQLVFENNIANSASDPLPDFVVRSQGTAFDSGQKWAPDSGCYNCDHHEFSPAGASTCFPCPFHAVSHKNDLAGVITDCRCALGWQKTEVNVDIFEPGDDGYFWRIIPDAGNPFCGVVEYEYGGWYNVHADSWDDNDAMVLCRALGAETGYADVPVVNDDTMPAVRIQNVQCTGRETIPDECPVTQISPADPDSTLPRARACCKNQIDRAYSGTYTKKTCTQCLPGSATYESYAAYQAAFGAQYPETCQVCQAGKFSRTDDIMLWAGTADSRWLNHNWNEAIVLGSADANIRAYCDECSNFHAEATSLDGATSAEECYCPAGYSGTIDTSSGGTCEECVAGKYRDRTGFNDANAAHHNCDDCEAGKYNELNAQTSESSCISCTDVTKEQHKLHSSTENAGSTGFGQCLCNAGYTKFGSPNVHCIECPAGKYKDVLGDQSCTDCPAGTAHDLQASTAPSDCVTCSQGSVALRTGMSACEECEAGTYQDLSAEVPSAEECESCPDFSTSPAGSFDILDCECNAGYFSHPQGHTADGTWNPAQCTECPAGFYCDGGTESSPVPCTGNTYSNTRQVSCTDCPSNGVIDGADRDDVTQCKCQAGYTGSITDPSPSESQCTACAPGTYKTSAGSETCTECNAGKFSTVTAKTDASCDDCPAFSTSPSGSDNIGACICAAGYWVALDVNGHNCLGCQAGYYCTGDESREECPESSTSPANSDNVGDCVCNAGFYQSNDATGECAVCHGGNWDANPPGAYCPGGIAEAQVQCPQFTASAAQSDGPDDCRCLQGYWRDECTPVDDVYTRRTLVRCPDDSSPDCFDVDGESKHYVLKQCINDVPTTGQYTFADFWALSCSTCPRDVYCMDGTMQHCPDHSTSPIQSDHHEDCVCMDGYKQNDL